MSVRCAEATAPCRVELAGGVEGAVTVSVAVDRRVFCRFEAGARLVTRSPAPVGAGLREGPALAAAIVAAATRVLGREPDAAERVRLASEAGVAHLSAAGDEAATCGGVVAVHAGAAPRRVELLAVDPGRVEESLLLVDAGDPVGEPASGVFDEAARGVASRVREALLGGRWDEIVGLWGEEWDARRRLASGHPGSERERIAAIVRGAGGAARLCEGGRGRFLAVWAPPGERGPGRREAVLAAAKAAGLRVVPARVDLRGLEVEEAAGAV